MSDFTNTAAENLQRANEILEETGLFRIWESVGAKPHLVGSLRTGLLMKHLDIDLHIYSDPFSLSASFAAMAELAQNRGIKRIEYANLLETEEKCLEWHAWFQDDDDRLWQIDMIHIHADSPFAGYFEKVADRIREALTPETRHAILAIKNEMPLENKANSIAIYQSVIRDGVRNYREFLEWTRNNPADGIMEWMP